VKATTEQPHLPLLDCNSPLALQAAIGEGLDSLFGLWDELGIEETAKDDRNQTVHDHFVRLLNK
jgi:hypothetical protein